MTAPKGAPREAGLSLDVLIAEQVMGWTWARVGFYWDRGGEMYLVPPEGPSAVHDTTSGSWDYLNDDPQRRVLYDLPSYSTDIAAAWLVVAEVQRRHPGWRFSLLGGDVSMGYFDNSPQRGVDESSRCAFGWRAEFFGEIDPRQNYGDRHGEAWGETPALAICRAVLAAPHPTPEDPQ